MQHQVLQPSRDGNHPTVHDNNHNNSKSNHTTNHNNNRNNSKSVASGRAAMGERLKGRGWATLTREPRPEEEIREWVSEANQYRHEHASEFVRRSCAMPRIPPHFEGIVGNIPTILTRCSRSVIWAPIWRALSAQTWTQLTGPQRTTRRDWFNGYSLQYWVIHRMRGRRSEPRKDRKKELVAEFRSQQWNQIPIENLCAALWAHRHITGNVTRDINEYNIQNTLATAANYGHVVEEEWTREPQQTVPLRTVNCPGRLKWRQDREGEMHWDWAPLCDTVTELETMGGILSFQRDQRISSNPEPEGQAGPSGATTGRQITPPVERPTYRAVVKRGVEETTPQEEARREKGRFFGTFRHGTGES